MIPGKFTMDVTLGVIPIYAIFPRALFPSHGHRHNGHRE